MDEEYTLDITLTEDEHETPINGTINLYLLDNPIPEEIILNNTGHIQKTYTVNKTGSSLTIYAEFEGNEQYNSQNSQTLYIDSEAYPTTLTLNEIENSLVFEIVSQIAFGTAISMMVSSLINTLMRSWVRFVRNVYKDESYLTHTLPVEKNSIYISKVITALITIFPLNIHLKQITA